MFSNTARRVLVCLMAILGSTATSCREDPVDVKPVFRGIAVTDANGRIVGSIGDASDDWRPTHDSCIVPSPAYPNPATASVRLNVNVCRASPVTITLESVPGRVAATVYNGVLQAGVHSFTFEVGSLPNGIYRCYLRSTRDNSISTTTYGDVMIER